MLKLVGKIKIITGLHIGMGKDQIGIGGIDAPVIKDHRNGCPYIPGSSLKGKIRSLLANGKEIENEPEDVQEVFGMASGQNVQVGKVIFRDAFLCEEDQQVLKNDKNKIYEEKMETAIDRSKGNAKGGSLRTIERVFPGLRFDLEIILRNKKHLGLIKRGIELLEDNYLGGMGTRGYGKVKIEDLKEEEISVDLKKTA